MADHAETKTPTYLIWWLTQDEWEAAAIRAMDDLPSYVREEFTKCQGFPSRARLWVSDELGIAILENADWMDAGPRAENETGTCGIVIREGDAEALKGWPGRVTDTGMKPAFETQGAFAP